MDLNSLNPQQREAVETVSGPVLLLAGAGTGKTMVITCRIAHLISLGVPPSSVLAVTFTNKAANEMKERIATMVSKRQAKDLTISTFHSFGLRTLAKFGSLIGYTSGFSLIDYGDQIGIVKEAMTRLSYLDEGSMDAPTCLAALSRAKNSYKFPEDLKNSEYADEQKVGHVYEMYQDYTSAINVMDFDDLLMQTTRLFEEFPEVAAQMRERYRYLMIDEFQDTNYIQMRMIKHICGDRPNICVVGDDDQSIYSWRGADINYILKFDENYAGCKVIKLEQNYRCTSNILNCANKVIGINSARHDKRLWSENGEGEKVKVIRCDSAEGEAQMISDVIQDRVLSGQNDYRDFAVLYRSNHQSRALEQRLRYLKLPYHLVGDKSFYERREVRDAIAYLNAAYNRTHNLSVLRILDVPPRGIGSKTIKLIRSTADDENIPVSDVIEDEDFLLSLGKAQGDAVREFTRKLNQHRKAFEVPGDLYLKATNYLNDMGYLTGIGRMYKPRADAEARYDNVLELLHSIMALEKRHEDGPILLHDFMQTVSLAEDYSRKKDENEEERNAITLLTVHASKGLEFPFVFIIGLEQNLFPHERSIKEKGLAEERRLFYVAMTRAKKDLIISWCSRRKIRHQQLVRKRSQFFVELPEEHYVEVTKQDLLQTISTQDMAAMLKAFRDSL
ncbi:MAG: UvrD-helicase domain-containing protein [Lentisphaeraceae bacterium]|nr:UvrD-helicase domain-containing protein [Lentisphaeraceae bacterium]